MADVELLDLTHFKVYMFACHSAACRPPTSGGTGGSVSAPQASAKSGSPSLKVVPGAHESTYTPTEFGRRIQAEIDNDPLLSQRIGLKGIHTEIAALKVEELQRMRESLPERMLDGRGSGLQPSQSGYSVEGREVENRLRDRLKDKDAIKRHIDDPNAEPTDEYDALIKAGVAARLKADPQQMSIAKGMIEGVNMNVQMWGAYPRAPKVIGIGDHQITPEFEQASTRIGHMINDEINARAEVKAVAASARHDEGVAKIAEHLGVEPKDISHIFTHGVILKDNVTRPIEQRAEAAKIAAEYGIKGSITKLNPELMRANAQREAYLEVMREIRPMGGPVDGIPRHRTTGSVTRLSTHEQVLSGTARYPTDWAHISDIRGTLNFKQAGTRARYNDMESLVELNGSASTAIHELGHRFEYSVPGLGRLEQHFYERRTAGEELQQLNVVTPGKTTYKDHEVTKTDEFFDTYVGRWYPQDNAYETFTMGMEAVSMSKRGIRQDGTINSIDPDHAAFILGALVTLVHP